MFKNIESMLEQIAQIAPEIEWNSSIKEADLNEILNANSVTNTELLTLYTWRNGNMHSFAEQNPEFCSFGYILPIDVATKIYNEKEFLGFKNDGFFPFISDFYGDYLLLKISAPEQPVYIYSPSLFIVTPEAIFENLWTFLLSINKCYLSKAYFIQNDQLMVDMDAEHRIFHKNSHFFKVWSENN